MIRKVALGVIAALACIAVVVTYVTPWPSVLVIRAVFDAGADEAAAALASKAPGDVQIRAGLRYDPADPDALFDIYRGRDTRADGPTIVWFHGGGFVSGRRDDVANYLKILAGRGFTVVNVDYTIAPEATYPTPIRQAHAVLSHLTRNADKLGINADNLVLAGDSAGAQIAAQTAATIANPVYAETVGVVPGATAGQISGTLLHCGVYDITDLGQSGGVLGWFVHSTVWAYSGERAPDERSKIATMSVLPWITSKFPPTFISAGNADPLLGQSKAFAQSLARNGVATTPVFFPDDHQPGLGHEYQFDLATRAGQMALDRSVEWLKERQP